MTRADSVRMIGSEARVDLGRARETLETLIGSQTRGQMLMETRLRTHEDWKLIALLLENEEKGQATTAPQLVKALEMSPGTVRAMLKRMDSAGYIVAQQKIARSDLYQPSEKLKEFLCRWAAAVGA